MAPQIPQGAFRFCFGHGWLGILHRKWNPKNWVDFSKRRMIIQTPSCLFSALSSSSLCHRTSRHRKSLAYFRSCPSIPVPPAFSLPIESPSILLFNQYLYCLHASKSLSISGDLSLLFHLRLQSCSHGLCRSLGELLYTRMDYPRRSPITGYIVRSER